MLSVVFILLYVIVRVVVVLYFCIVFFFKQKTAYEMRISDWSSDVCSSDLRVPSHPHLVDPREAASRDFTSPKSGPRGGLDLPRRGRAAHARQLIEELAEIAPQAQQRAEEQREQGIDAGIGRSEEHTSELQPLMRISYAVLCLTKKNKTSH